MNIVFMGTPDFAVSSLSALVNAGHNVTAVFTQSDKPVGRHKVITPPPVKTCALEHSIKVFQPQTLKNEESFEIIKNENPDVIVVVAYGMILPQNILDIPKYGCVNVHGSLLPKYRGAAPIQWSVINSEEYAGITTMYMDKGLDTGDIIYKEKLKILPYETSGELYKRLAVLGADLLIKTLNDIENSSAPREKQDDSLSTYAPMLDKQMALLDFSKTKKQICSLVAGLNPWPVAYSFVGGKRFKVYNAQMSDKTGNIGELLDDKKLIIGCKDGSVELVCVQIEGSNKQSGEEYLRGHKASLGKFFD